MERRAVRQSDEEADCVDCGDPLIRAGVVLCDVVITNVTRTKKEYRCKACEKKRVKK
jgi:hypothetical protein